MRNIARNLRILNQANTRKFAYSIKIKYLLIQENFDKNRIIYNNNRRKYNKNLNDKSN